MIIVQSGVGDTGIMARIYKAWSGSVHLFLDPFLALPPGVDHIAPYLFTESNTLTIAILIN